MPGLPNWSNSRFELLQRIASGGMGTVYLARKRGALGFTRLFAIKRPHPHLAEDRALREHLISEARIAGLLNHPNVVSVLDVEEVHGEVLLIMDYVEGASLGELMRRMSTKGDRLPSEVAVRIVLDVALGLQAAHEARGDDGKSLDLVHRDVSPQNILVGLDGIARLTDFGIAKALASQSGAKTDTGMLKGKSGYMAPEYIRGEPFDRRSDEFALAVVAWEALAGKSLFGDEESIRSMMKLLSMDPPSLVLQLGQAADEVDNLIRRALSKEPSLRFATVKDFADALELAALSCGLVAERDQVAGVVRECVGAELEQRRHSARLSGNDDQHTLSMRLPETITVLASNTARMTPSRQSDDESVRTTVLTVNKRSAKRPRWMLMPLALASAALGGAWLTSQAIRPTNDTAPATPESATGATAIAEPVVSSDIHSSTGGGELTAQPSVSASASSPTPVQNTGASRVPGRAGTPKSPATPKMEPDPNPYGELPSARPNR